MTVLCRETNRYACRGLDARIVSAFPEEFPFRGGRHGKTHPELLAAERDRDLDAESGGEITHVFFGHVRFFFEADSNQSRVILLVVTHFPISFLADELIENSMAAVKSQHWNPLLFFKVLRPAL